MVEGEAFKKVHAAWARVGYPFGSLVPSYATAIGSSADRPAALAELIGIILNDGVRQPTVRIEADRARPGDALRDASGCARRNGASESFPAEVAATLRRALIDVVANGTAKRVDGAYVDGDKRVLPIGGKTGTGDELSDTYRGKDREVSRSAAFAFFIGDRFFGVVTAHVPGDQARHYNSPAPYPHRCSKFGAGDRAANRHATTAAARSRSGDSQGRPEGAISQRKGRSPPNEYGCPFDQKDRVAARLFHLLALARRLSLAALGGDLAQHRRASAGDHEDGRHDRRDA